MDKDHLDSIWYGGDMVSIKIGKYYITITTAGDVRAIINGNYYCDKNDGGMFAEYLPEQNIHNDKELKEQDNLGNIEWLNNNWFELIIWDDEQKDYVDYGDNVVDLEPDDNFSWLDELVKEL